MVTPMHYTKTCEPWTMALEQQHTLWSLLSCKMVQ